MKTISKIMAFVLFLFIISCTEKAKVVGIDRIDIDTTYIYKIERTYDEGIKFYDMEDRKYKYSEGDVIKINR